MLLIQFPAELNLPSHASVTV